MTITLNHTIVFVRDKKASSKFLTDLFGLPPAKPFGPFLGNFVRQDEHRLLVGVEPPIEPEAFAPLVLAPQRDLERPNILFIEKRRDDLACRALLERHQLAQRFSAQFLRQVPQRSRPGRSSQKLELSAATNARQHDPGLRTPFAGADAQNQDEVGDQRGGSRGRKGVDGLLYSSEEGTSVRCRT